MNKQRGHQTAFITMAFGGPKMPYKGRDMDAAHVRTRCAALCSRPPGLNSFPTALPAAYQALTDASPILRRSHSAMGLNDEDFDTVVATLGATMKEFNMSDEQIAQAAAVTETTRDAVRSNSRSPRVLLLTLAVCLFAD